MASGPAKQDNYDLFREKYSRPRKQAVLQVERTVLGHDAGLNGYTTVEQAQELCDHLNLSAGSRLLDVGSGRGWPGLHLARETSCAIVCTDIPLDALRDARTRVETHCRESNTEVVAADGRVLPFQTGSFDGVVHADVFC